MTSAQTLTDALNACSASFRREVELRRNGQNEEATQESLRYIDGLARKLELDLAPLVDLERRDARKLAAARQADPELSARVAAKRAARRFEQAIV